MLSPLGDPWWAYTPRGMLGVILRGLLACVLLSAGSCAYTTMGEVHSLTCNRADGACVLKKETTVRIPVADLTGAEVEDYRTTYPNAPGNRSAKSERLVLLTRQGRVPFMDFYSGIGMDEMAVQKAEVDDFVRRPERPSLHIRRDERVLAAVMGGIPFVIGLGCLVSAVREYRRWWEA